MKAEFIGHGLNNKLKTVHYYLKKSFLDNSYDTFIGFSAYTKKTGLDLIQNELIEAKQKFKKITFYLGIVDKGTSVEALEFLLENNIDTFVFYSGDSYIFHPKIYFFDGENEKRIIVGSSNLTKSGLTINGNIEASILIDYSKLDTSGLKLQRQYFDYFGEIINRKNNLVKQLTTELLEEYTKKGIVIKEFQTFENENSKKWTLKKTKRKKQKEEIIEENNNKKTITNKGNGVTFSITPQYLKTWDKHFELFKKFKEKHNGKVTIPSSHSNKALYRWYRLQKIFYADDSINSEYELKYEHIGKLVEENFYFEDAHLLIQKNIENEWLSILTDALNDDEEKDKIQVNHRYKYKGNRLGTWLVGVSQATKEANSKPEKVKLRRKIEKLGFNFTKTSRKPEHISKRFIEKLLSDKNPIKTDYQNIFNHQFLPRSNKISDELKQEINTAWELQFNEKRSWEVISRKKDRTDDWKEYRYNKELNPAGKWLTSEKKMGSLYFWTLMKRKNKKKMDLFVDKFTEEELKELKAEGFPIEI